jgi:phosphoribosylaminoimidazolecarboxamide formyltransferase/IMP cyclohydrolase
VHGGLLARRDLPQHLSELTQNRIEPIDMVVVNLYPFVETVSKPGVSLNEALENIDIGGPSMLRSAAKNFPSVLVVVDPGDYDTILQNLRQGNIDSDYRKRLAQKAFQHVALYDTAIAQYLNEEALPEEMTIALKKAHSLRYGENPHQQAAFYVEQNVRLRQDGLASLEQLGGPEVSFNNLLDLDAALNVLSDFVDPTIAIMKHTNSCGLASHNDLAEAYRRALTGDPVASFGGVVASNRSIDLSTAKEIDKTHYDAVVAPEYQKEAFELLGRKQSLRLVKVAPYRYPSSSESYCDFRYIRGGFLAQSQDLLTEAELRPRTVSKRQPSDAELSDLLFAWKAVKGIKSNAIVIAKDKTLLGMGAGQPSRVVSVELALKRAGDRTKNIIEPGGSVRDKEVIELADKYNVAIVFTGVRHFRH